MDTRLKNHMFKSARIQLTLWYLLIIMTISLLFSAVIYQVLTVEINRFEEMHRTRLEERLEDEDLVFRPRGPQQFRAMMADPELVEETKERILFSLLVINGGIILVSGVLGYLLAGRTLRPIEDMTHEQNRFISDASHEIKTPLTSLKTAFEVFLRSKSKTLGEASEIMKDSILEVDRLQKLSDSLLQLAQFEKPQKVTSMKRVSVDTIATEGIKQIQYLAKSRHIVIKKKLHNFTIRGDAEQLIKLMVILLDNAVKYSAEKSTVTLTTEVEDLVGIIEVRDKGIGIDMKDIPHIFDRLYRADSSRSSSEYQGYGLGLAIAQKIVEQHKGTIKVVSTKGAGATFTVTLPLHQK